MIEDELVDRAVRTFRDVLASSWAAVVAASDDASTGSYVQDWAQATWEMLVEGLLPAGSFLEVYGEGADCNDGSSRVYKPEALPSCEVVVKACRDLGSIRELISESDISMPLSGIPLDEFVTPDGSWYATAAPFDCVLCEQDDQPLMFRTEDVKFGMRKK